MAKASSTIRMITYNGIRLMSCDVEIKLVDPIANFDQAVELLEANWKESGNPFEFNAVDAKSFYTHMAEMRLLFAVGAYLEEKLVGYCIVTIAPHPLNFSIKICDANGLYLIPDLRGGRTLSKITNAVRLLAKEHNANLIHWHAPAGSDFSKALASRFTPMSNYFREELVYDK